MILGGSPPTRRRPRSRLFLLGGVVLLLLGGGLVSLASAGERVLVGTIPASDIGHGKSAGSGGLAPVALSIPSIGVAALIVAVPLTKQRGLGLPRSYASVGWWRDGAGLGADAPVLLTGHVDDSHGPTVFYHLRQLKVGAPISLTAATGKTTNYVVDALREYPDNQIPAELVYGRTARPTLRLITCSGYSWWHGGRYLNNLMVFAHAITHS